MQRFFSVNPGFYWALADWFEFLEGKAGKEKVCVGGRWTVLGGLSKALYVCSLTSFVGFNAVNYQPC